MHASQTISFSAPLTLLVLEALFMAGADLRFQERRDHKEQEGLDGEVPQSGPGVRLKYFCLNTAIFTSQAVFLQNERLSSTKGIYGSPVL